MIVIFNYLGGGVAVLAFFLSLVIAGRMAMGDRAEFAGRFPYVLGTLLLVADLTARCYGWRKILRRSRAETVLTRDGAVAAPRQRGREVLESLLHPEAGGQLFFLPVWFIGAALVVAKLTGILGPL